MLFCGGLSKWLHWSNTADETTRRANRPDAGAEWHSLPPICMSDSSITAICEAIGCLFARRAGRHLEDPGLAAIIGGKVGRWLTGGSPVSQSYVPDPLFLQALGLGIAEPPMSIGTTCTHFHSAESWLFG